MLNIPEGYLKFNFVYVRGGPEISFWIFRRGSSHFILNIPEGRPQIQFWIFRKGVLKFHL